MAYRVIVADNSASVQKAVKMAFSDSEFEIYPFHDGKEVLKELRQIEPDVVLLRLSLPPEGGYEVAHRIKGEEGIKRASLILLRGVFEPVDQTKMAELEYDEIIQVPFDSNKLANLVQDLIERRKDPQSLPEEIELDEVSGPQIKTGLDKEIKAWIRKEIIDSAGEMEERVKSRLLPEIKSWLLQWLKEHKNKENKSEP